MDDVLELCYPNVEAWVADWLADMYARRLGQAHAWCPEWYLHAEALSRLDALWRAWECLRQDAALGMSVWWRDHADPHMTVLLSPGGPFAACRGKHTAYPTAPLPVIRAPGGVFPDEREPLPDADIPLAG